MSTSPVAPQSSPAWPAQARPSLTVLAGFWSRAVRAVADDLLAADPTLLVVEHELRRGYARRTVRSWAGLIEAVRVADGRTLTEDVLDAVAGLAALRPYRDMILILPETVVPEGLVFGDAVRVDSYVTVVDTEHLLDALGTDDDLAGLGLATAGDGRHTLAGLVARQIEHADTIVTTQEDPQVDALLHRLAPWAARVRPGDGLRHSHRHRPETPPVLNRGLEGFALGVHEPVAARDVVSAVFRARRPFHPRRLHDALGAINDGVLRSRGHLWLANRPDDVVSWEYAGGVLGLGALGRWLAVTPDADWELASGQRRLAAALEWDVYYGDRHHCLVFVGLELDVAALHRRLTGCLLTDAELSEGEESWRRWEDAFGTR